MSFALFGGSTVALLKLICSKSCVICIMIVCAYHICLALVEHELSMLCFFLGEKEPKPVSGRVKEIAEFMLSCVMEKIVRKGEDAT